MRKLFNLFTICLAMSCSQGLSPDSTGSNFTDQSAVEHGMIVLGDKLDDPYTVENMQKALSAVYGTKAERINIRATDYYVRFLPKDDDQFKLLCNMGLYLIDHPMDYSIVREGDYYQDPEIGDEAITWQYAVVPNDFIMPEGIEYEIIDDIYISEHAPTTRSDIDWELVEREAFRITGNESMLQPLTKADSFAPAGRITVVDPDYSGGKPIGVSGVKVVCNVFVKFATAWTDRDGYYQMTKKFTGSPRYRIVFQNEKSFSIGFNFLIVPASVSTLGKGSPEGMDIVVSREESDNALFRRCVVNNSAYDYISRCTEEDLGILPPPGDLRIWIFPGLTCSSASMLHHGAGLNHQLLQAYLSAWIPLIKLFLPDITIGTKEMGYYDIYQAVAHELAHASHYSKVGNGFWGPYIDYVIYSFITEGFRTYGSGSGENAGYCEIGEMWGYFMQETLKKDRYGGTVRQFGNTFWFKPDIFTYLYERGLSRSDIFGVLSADVTDIEELKSALADSFPEHMDMIESTFRHYGK